MTDNIDLRQQAVRAITNYMHHELFEVTGSFARAMLPFMEAQANELMLGVDRAIEKTKARIK